MKTRFRTLVSLLLVGVAAASMSLVGAPPLSADAFDATAEFEIDDLCFDGQLPTVAFLDFFAAMQDRGFALTTGYDFSRPAEPVYENPPFTPGNKHFDDPRADYGALVRGGDAQVRLSGRDVVFVQVCTPSSNNSFEYSGYLTREAFSSGGVPELRSASLGDSINPLTMVGDPYTSLLTIVATADQISMDDTVDAINEVGLSGEVHLLPINDGTFVHADNDGSFPQSLWGLLSRRLDLSGGAAVPRQDYVVSVFRKAGDAIDPLDVPLRDTFSAVHDDLTDLDPAFDEMVTAIGSRIDARPGYMQIGDVGLSAVNGLAGSEIAAIFEHGLECIAEGINCGFDVRDDLYTWPGDALLLEEDDLYLLVGIDLTDLQRLGGPMATWATVGAYVVSDPEGSEDVFLPVAVVANEDVRAVPNSFIPPTLPVQEQKLLRGNSLMFQITRPQNCIDQWSGLCLSLDDLADDEPFVVMTQATLNPETATMPDETQVIHWRLLHFKVDQ